MPSVMTPMKPETLPVEHVHMPHNCGGDSLVDAVDIDTVAGCDENPQGHSHAEGGGIRWGHVGRNLLMVPVFPMAGYLLLDRTGISHAMIQSGLIPKAVLGEGFGHVGLCFSLHYVIHAVQDIYYGLRRK